MLNYTQLYSATSFLGGLWLGWLRFLLILRLTHSSLAGDWLAGLDWAWQFDQRFIWWPDLENAARGASSACGHFVENPAIFRKFESNILYFWLRMAGEEVKIDKWGYWWRNEDLYFKIEGGGLWTEDGQSSFEDSIMSHQHLIRIFRFTLCCESCWTWLNSEFSTWGWFAFFSRSGCW